MLSSWWLSLCCLLLLSVSAHAGAQDIPARNDAMFFDIPVLEDSHQRINLARHALTLEDPDQRYQFADLTAVPQQSWQKVPGTHINMGKNGSAWWIAVALDNRTGANLEGVLEINYPILDQVELFHIDPLQNLSYQSSGACWSAIPG